jgi:hypothetical protein
MKWLGVIILWISLAWSVQAQDPAITAPAVPRTVALSIVNDTLVITQENLPDNTLIVDYHPLDNTRTARVDMFGMIRYSPIGSPEGVYTFSPYYSGYGVQAPQENKLFVTQVAWSPDGDKLAFRVEQLGNPDVSNGVWFWQPAMEFSSDPSYQIMRHCPPSCDIVLNPSRYQWRTLGFEWSSNSNGILIGLQMTSVGRDAITVRYARREQDNAQGNTAPAPYFYDYGHWTLDGENIVVSGTNPDGVVGYGRIQQDGTVLEFNPVASPTWVQNAVQAQDGTFYMFASPVGIGQALQLITGQGTQITPILGETAPTRIVWNAERTAALVVVDRLSYVVQINGTVTDITSIVATVPAVDWTDSPPQNATAIATPTPLIVGGTFSIGDILRVATGAITIYAEPVNNATVVGVLNVGEELIITSDPVQSGNTTWLRVQSINFTGWINTSENLARSN